MRSVVPSGKICLLCKLEKETNCFSKNKRSLDGLQDRCKLCCKQYRDFHIKINLNKKLNVTHKNCTKCKQLREVKYFSPKLNAPGGVEYWCIFCRRQYAKQYRNKNN